jgi:hypothetical protein
MNKNLLRSMISALNINDNISIHYRGSPGPVSATVIEKKTGRGKGGSLFAVLEEDNGNIRVIGTPSNDEVLSIEHNGVFSGVQDERGDLPMIDANPPMAAEIKAATRSILGDAGVGRKVRIASTFGPLNGTYTVLDARPEKGRFGQIHLQLTSDDLSDGFVVNLWSYRNSGLITEFEVLPE